MIAPLRQRHRRAWFALALVLPILAFIAWRARQPAAVMDRLPAQLTSKP